jgi:hypothetical protein
VHKQDQIIYALRSAVGTYASETYVNNQIATHATAGDPHAGYQKEAEKGQANGYSGLSSDVKVTVGQLRNPIWVGPSAPNPSEYPLWLDTS